MEIAGVPLHPLVVHAVVVSAPLGALTAIVYAVRPGGRWLLRWPLVVLAAVSLATAFVATLTGESLLEARPLGQLPAVQEHEERGELLRTVLIGFALAAGVGAWRLGGPSGLKSDRGARTLHGGVADVALSGLLVVTAIVVLVAVVLAGHSGSEAVWKI